MSKQILPLLFNIKRQNIQTNLEFEMRLAATYGTFDFILVD
jgi:hypothetical protein